MLVQYTLLKFPTSKLFIFANFARHKYLTGCGVPSLWALWAFLVTAVHGCVGLL
jgi:hypothetical protein